MIISNISIWRRQLFVLALCLFLFYLIYNVGIDSGTINILPGPAMRSRDAIAIAISFLKNNDWLGFAAYKEILLEVSANGVTIDPFLSFKNFGTEDYQLLLRAPEVTNNAISRAYSLKIDSQNLLWFPDGDDIGLSIYFGLAFMLFGLKVSSLFWMFLLLIALSITSYFAAFWKHLQALIMAPIFLLVIKILIQAIVEIELDVNSIVSSRFLPILGYLAYTHVLMICLLSIKLNNCKQIFFFILQSLILVFLVVIRSSSVWMPIGFICISLVILSVKYIPILDYKVFKKIQKLNPLPFICFMIIYVAVMSGLSAIKHETFKVPPLVSQHIFWHPLITVLHNNPDRDVHFGIPKNLSADPLTDNLGYFLFERYIKEKNIDRANYLIKDSEVSRLRGIPYLWGEYDKVLKKVFLSDSIQKPYYAASSFFWHQPLNLFKVIRFFYMKHISKFLNIENFLIYFSLILVYQKNLFKNISIGLIGLSSCMSIIPAMMVAPQELRIIDMVNSFSMFGLYLIISILFSAISKIQNIIAQKNHQHLN